MRIFALLFSLLFVNLLAADYSSRILFIGNSYLYYNDSKYWWTIALTNSKPTDAHFSIGDIVYIPENPYYIAELLK